MTTLIRHLVMTSRPQATKPPKAPPPKTPEDAEREQRYQQVRCALNACKQELHRLGFSHS